MRRYRKLSAPQRAALKRLYEAGPGGEHTPRGGTASSAWYRTMASLFRKGLIHYERVGDHWRAVHPTHREVTR